MPVPQALVTRFVQLLLNRQFTEAERELERIKQKMHKTEWNRGYFRALYGMMLARKGNGDGYAFFSKLDLTDKTALHGYRREFMNHLQSKLHGEFDRGYFSAWTDCMRVLTRIDVSSIPNASSLVSSNGRLEAVKAVQSQATIENFIKQEED